MKKSILYIASMFVAMAGFTSCDDDFEQAPLEDYIPHATMVANTTAQELKEAFNQTSSNYYNVPIGTRADGSHYIVKGRVTSSDKAANVYKKLMIADETGGLIFSVDNSKLYETYRIGQEVVVDVTGLYYGNYGTGMQIGVSAPDGSAPNRISKDMWEGTTTRKAICQLNNLPAPAKVDVPSMTVSEVNALLLDDATKLAWQGRLVRITGVHFQSPGTLLARVLATGETNPNNTSYLIDDKNNRIAMNTSSYSTFGTTTKAPKGTGDVVALLTLYNNNWQIVLNDLAGLEGFEPWVDRQTIFSESFETNQGEFTIDNVQMDPALTHIWEWRDKYGMVATAFANSTNYASDSWLISPVVALPADCSPVLTFDQALNFFSSIGDAVNEVSVSVREPNGEWVKLDIPSWPASLSWTFVNTGDIDLSAYAGKNIQIGLRYTSTAAKSGTWEVKNFQIVK